MAIGTTETLPALYEADETAWLEAMAELAGEGRVAELDLPHLAEFLADMAKSRPAGGEEPPRGAAGPSLEMGRATRAPLAGAGWPRSSRRGRNSTKTPARGVLAQARRGRPGRRLPQGRRAGRRRDRAAGRSLPRRVPVLLRRITDDRPARGTGLSSSPFNRACPAASSPPSGTARRNRPRHSRRRGPPTTCGGRTAGRRPGRSSPARRARGHGRDGSVGRSWRGPPGAHCAGLPPSV